MELIVLYRTKREKRIAQNRRRLAFIITAAAIAASLLPLCIPALPESGIVHAEPLNLVPMLELAPAEPETPPSSHPLVSAQSFLIPDDGAHTLRGAAYRAVKQAAAESLARSFVSKPISTPKPPASSVSSNGKIGSYVIGREYKFKTTGYCHCEKCNGKWAYGPLANGGMPVEGRTVAMGGVPLGTRVLVNGHKYIVEDRGVSGDHIDVFYNTHQDAWNHGKRTAAVVFPPQ